MGMGMDAFEYCGNRRACGLISKGTRRCVIFEIGGAPDREELARDSRVVLLFLCRVFANTSPDS